MVAINLAPAEVDISGVRAGDRNLFVVNVRTGGTPLNLTGYTVTAQARLTVGESTSLNAVCVITDSPNGVVSVRWPGDAVRSWLAGQNTQKGVWDLQLDDGTGGDPWTIISGTFAAEMDVTRSA